MSQQWAEPDNPAGDARERSDLKKHMLVEDPPPQRLEGHKKNVPSDSEDEGKRQSAGEPWRGSRQISMQIEVKKAKGHDRKAYRGSDGGPRNRSDAENHREDEAPGFAHQIALFFFEGPELARVGDRISAAASPASVVSGYARRWPIGSDRLLHALHAR